jgi:hypothetical protein
MRIIRALIDNANQELNTYCVIPSECDIKTFCDSMGSIARRGIYKIHNALIVVKI